MSEYGRGLAFAFFAAVLPLLLLVGYMISR